MYFYRYDDVFRVEQMCDENRFLKSPPAKIGTFEKQLKFNGQRYATKLPYVKDSYALPLQRNITKEYLKLRYC